MTLSNQGSREVFGACPHDCPDTCALIATVENGRVVAVRGNPDHPFTRGALCVKVKDYERRIYSPDRILHPLRRTGPKGEGRFERITWDEALDEIARRFDAIVTGHGAQAILPCSYMGSEGLLNGLNCGDAFFNRLGASVAERTFCNAGATAAYAMTLGASPGLDPESFAHARLILLWACNVVGNMPHAWHFIAAARGRGARVVVIDPLRSRTAAKADWHVRPRPGTDAALALGMMNVIVAEGLADEDYVARHTLGFDALKRRAADYPPERAAAITGVPADEIRALARAYATAQPAAIRIGVAIERHASGGQAVRAICCLPALVGAWRHVGGGIMQSSGRAFPIRREAMQRADLIRPGTRAINLLRLGAALTGELGLDPPVKALFVYNCNPAVVCPEQGKVIAGLAREDLFTVVSEQFRTDTADFADILLPATTQLEQLDLMFSWGHHYLTLNRPAIPPRGEAVSNSELFRRLAARMGFDDASLQRSDEQLLADSLDWSAPALAGIDRGLLEGQGWARLSLPRPDRWAPYAEGGFLTPSGKCEFLSSLAAQGSFVPPQFRQGHAEGQGGEPVDPLPAWTPPHESAERDPERARRYPLSLLSPKSLAFLNSCYANLPTQARAAGPQHVLIHPEDAAARNIADGAPVRVFNGRGAVEAVARISGDTPPGIVVMPMGHWRKHSRTGATVNALTSAAFADIGHAPTFSDNRVEMEPA